MAHYLIAALAVSIPWIYCQSYGNNGTASSTTAATTTTSSGGLVSSPGCTGSCQASFNYTNMTREVLYRQLVIDVANTENDLDLIALQAKREGKTINGSTTGKNLKAILIADYVNGQLQAYANGSTPMTGQQCLDVNTLGAQNDQFPGAFDIVPGNCTCLQGEDMYSAKLHAVGAALLAMINVSNDTNPYPGEYLQLIQALVKGLNEAREAVKNKDTGPFCLQATKDQALPREKMINVGLALDNWSGQVGST